MEQLRQSNPLNSVLVVEDDRDALGVLSLMIGKKFPGFTVYTAEHGGVGLELFRRYRPDLVITDVNMPVMNGMDMAAEIKSIKPGTKFIVLTAYNEKVFFERFKKIGFSAYILKPVEFKKLFDEINKCLTEIGPNNSDHSGQ